MSENYLERDFKEESFVKKNSLESTEAVLKKLLINIESFKKIEQENNELKKILLENQKILNYDYKKKFLELTKLLKEKEDIKEKTKTELLLKYKAYFEKIFRELIKSKQENNNLKKRYSVLFELTKKTINDNKNLQLLLKHNHEINKLEFEKKLFKILKEYKDNKFLLEKKSKDILKDYELKKINIGKNYEIEKQKNLILANKNKELSEKLKERENQIKKIVLLNQKFLKKIEILEKNSLANNEILKIKTNELKNKFEDNLKLIAKEFLKKELSYKEKINSLTEDLEKYYNELKEIKKKYYERENELKEKFADIFIEKNKKKDF
ncbi:MAG: hypothetical protein QXM96_02850 [Candidatus Woesearchaeota archaeon]